MENKEIHARKKGARGALQCESLSVVNLDEEDRKKNREKEIP